MIIRAIWGKRQSFVAAKRTSGSSLGLQYTLFNRPVTQTRPAAKSFLRQFKSLRTLQDVNVTIPFTMKSCGLATAGFQFFLH